MSPYLLRQDLKKYIKAFRISRIQPVFYRPVKIIVALPAGGSVDMIARTLGQKLNTSMGQAFVVDNRAGMMFETRTQIKLLHVPYRGSALAVNDALAGTVDAMFAVMPETLPHIRSGKFTALGVMSPQRAPVLPNVTTMAESSLKDIKVHAELVKVSGLVPQ